MTYRFSSYLREGIWLLLLLPPTSAVAQDVPIGSVYASRFQQDRVRFDSIGQVVFAWRKAYDRREPAIAWAQADGQRAGYIDPLKEFPNADGFDIGDIAAAPENIVVAGIVQARERSERRPPRHVLMVYDRTGTLRALWQVNPYHHHNIAVDHAGNIYALGHRIDGQAGNMIIKYSPEGAVAGEFSLSALFPTGDDALFPNRNGDVNQFWLDGERLMLYMASSHQLFQFDRDGKVQRRVSLVRALAQLADDEGAKRADITKLAVDSSGSSLLMQVRMSSDATKTFSSTIASVPILGGRVTRLQSVQNEELGSAQMPLLGRSGDKILYLNRQTATILRR